MGEEPDNHGARCSAESAVRTGDIATLGGAYYHLPTRRGFHSVRGIGWEHDDDRTAIDFGEFVGLAQCVRAEVDPKPVAVRESDGGTIPGGLRGIPDHRLVRVCPASAPRLCPHQLGQHLGIDIVAIAG